MTGSGIAAYGSHVPFWRLTGATVAAALGKRASPAGRAVASYDQDTTTLAVEAARVALGCAPAGTAEAIDALAFATTAPVYADKTNATAVHAALGLPGAVRASDAGASSRGGIAALIAALRSRELTLVAVSDVNTGPAGSASEAYGDAAAAFIAGESDDLVAEFLGAGSVSAEFEDRWRSPGAPWSNYWEERFAETIYAKLGEESFTSAVKAAGIAPADVSHLAITGVSPRAAARVSKAIGLDRERLADDLSRSVGFSGAAHPALLLASVLDVAQPGDIIALVSLVDGSDTILLRATPALAGRRSSATVAAQIDAGNPGLSYIDFLSWTGQVQRQMPRRPQPARVAAPPANRRVTWKYGFQGSACRQCATRHLPPQDVCLRCGAVNDMEPVPLADAAATIVTYTVDHLAYSQAPPVVAAVLDFDGGGRYPCELTDVDPASVAVGQRVQMTFRRISASDGVANYFWKARPVTGEPGKRREPHMSSHGIKDRVAIVGMGCTNFGERWESSAEDMMVESVTAALESAGMGKEDVDAFWLGTLGTGNSGMLLSSALKLDYKPVTRVENFCASGSEAFRNACYAVASGAYDVVMAVGVEKLKDSGYSGLTVAGPPTDGTESTLTAPAAFSMLAPAYAAKHGVDRSDFKDAMTHVAWKNHYNGARNSRAQFRAEVPKEKIRLAPAVAGDLGIFDCSGVSDGSAAAIIVRAEDALKYTDHPLYVKALSFAAGPGTGPIDPDYDYTSFEEVVKSAEDAYRQADVSAPSAELMMAEVHDCFTPTELVLMEDLGFSTRGTAWKDSLNGRFDLRGELPVNPDGGLKSFGHPIGASGLRMLFECWLQLRGEAPTERQIEQRGKRYALTQNLGGRPGDCVSFVSIVGAELG